MKTAFVEGKAIEDFSIGVDGDGFLVVDTTLSSDNLGLVKCRDEVVNDVLRIGIVSNDVHWEQYTSF